MLMSLGGVDAIVFTAGVGEHVARIRAEICERVGFLDLTLDVEKNEASPVDKDKDIAAAESEVRVLVIHTQEDWAIVQECVLLDRTITSMNLNRQSVLS